MNIFDSSSAKNLKVEYYFITISKCKFFLSFEDSVHPDYITVQWSSFSRHCTNCFGPTQKKLWEFFPQGWGGGFEDRHHLPPNVERVTLNNKRKKQKLGLTGADKCASRVNSRAPARLRITLCSAEWSSASVSGENPALLSDIEEEHKFLICVGLTRRFQILMSTHFQRRGHQCRRLIAAALARRLRKTWMNDVYCRFDRQETSSNPTPHSRPPSIAITPLLPSLDKETTQAFRHWFCIAQLQWLNQSMLWTSFRI